ncbi:MAG: DUF4382 domain-containing protein [Fimbriimonadaceae bacterium]|nr:DUF4382 domain-containing protein [Fimbriimonadaceae bacterium]
MKLFNRILAAAVLVAAIGCGGGGGGGGGAAGQSASIFITDNLIVGYDHVWATVKKVELNKVGGGTSVVYNDSLGTTLDLRSLRDGSGRRFKFLAREDNLSGQFEGVTVTLDDDVVLYPTGATTGQPRLFQGAVGGNKVLSAAFPAQAFGPGNDDLSIDFDLAQWNDNGTEVTDAVIVAVLDDNSVDDPGRCDDDDYKGTISNLQGTAPDLTFTLTRNNMSFEVQCDANTRIHRSEGSGNPVLANGQRVEVRGKFLATTNVLDADKIKIEDANSAESDEAQGTVSNLDAVAGSMKLDVYDADHFIPVSNPIDVASTDSTKYRARSGVIVTRAEFFALLSDGAHVEVEGDYDSGTNTLTAKKMKLEDGDGGGGGGGEDEAEVKGATGSVDLGAFTFTVVATNFSGINVPPGTVIDVVTNGSTKYRGLSGGSQLTQAEFFAALSGTPGQKAEVEGHWNGTVLTAKKCKLED